MFLPPHDSESSSLTTGYMFGPSSRSCRTNTASADFWKPLRIPHEIPSHLRQVSRPPRVRITTFPPHPPHLLPYPLMATGFALSRKLARVMQPDIRFVFLGSGFCLRLLSGSTSRWIYPCLRLTVSTIKTGKGLSPPSGYPCRAHVRHPPQSGWLDELGRLKGDRPINPNVALKRASVP